MFSERHWSCECNVGLLHQNVGSFPSSTWNLLCDLGNKHIGLFPKEVIVFIKVKFEIKANIG